MNFFIVFIAQYLIYVVFLFAALVFFNAAGKKRIKMLKLVVISFPLAYLVAKVAAHVINDPRPFVTDHVKPLFTHVADNGFPSDHTLLAMTIAGVIFIHNKKYGVLLALLSVCIGFARVFAHVHHIEDIIGSIIIALAAVYIAYVLLPFLKTIKK